MKLIKALRRRFLLGAPAIIHPGIRPAGWPLAGVSVGREYTRDAQTIPFRMPAGFPGTVNRTHPVSIETVSLDVTNPPAGYGVPGVIDSVTHLFRKLLVGDGALTDLYGITVRPFPFQDTGLAAAYGAVTIGQGGIASGQKMDVMRNGYMIVPLNNFAAAPSVKGGTVFVWIAATIANHVQGGFESAASGGNTIQIGSGPTTTFNGPPDASGNVEVVIHQ